MNPLTTLFAIALLATSAVAQLPQPGSVLIFPSVRANAATISLVSVTNTATTPINDDIFAYYNYVQAQPNPNDPFRPQSCLHFCRAEFLTANDTTTNSVGCHSPYPNTQGYLVVIAQSATTGQRISHNHLLGTMTVFDLLSGLIYSYSAGSFGSPRPDGQAIPGGPLSFDGVNYERMHCDLYVDAFIAGTNPRLALAAFHSLPSSAEVSTSFSIWNDDEFPLSFTFGFRCWFEIEVANISSVFTQGFLLGVANDANETDINCDQVGDFESVWFRIRAQAATLPGGAMSVPNPPLMGALVGGPASLSGARLLWGSRQRCDGVFH